MKNYILLLVCLLCAKAYAQQIKNNDCVNIFPANRILNGTTTTFTSDNINGRGAINDFGTSYQNYPGCLLPQSGFVEVQSAWYAFQIKTSGTLTFTITPLGSSDFDFALFGPNKSCNALGTSIRCSFAANPTAQNVYNTGLNLSSGDVSEPASGDGFVKYIDGVAGETYHLFINNWSNSNQGFSISFGGTATLEPQILTSSATVSCNQASFSTVLSGLSASQAQYNWDFGDGSPITYQNGIPNPTHYYNNAGTYTATLTFTNLSNNTVTTHTHTVTIVNDANIPTQVDFVGLADNYCSNDAPVVLNATGLPIGGVFSYEIYHVESKNIINNPTVFNPNLGAGTYQVKVIYSNGSCGIQKIKQVVVTQKPIVFHNAGSNNHKLCVGSNPISLNSSLVYTFPAGGTLHFDITTPNNTILNNQTSLTPSIVGNYTIKAIYTLNTCITTKDSTVQVYPLPTPVFAGLQDVYAVNADAFLLSATPAGGTFKINDINATQFSPAILGIGVHQVSYTVADVNGCSGTVTKMVTVAPVPLPPATFSATPVYPFQMNLQWSTVANATGYTIYRSTTQGSNYTQIGTSTANITTYTDNNLTPAQAYFYVVRTQQGTLLSPNSSEVTAIATHVENKILNDLTSIVPNPSKGEFMLKLPENIHGSIQITVFDTQGKQVFEKELQIASKEIYLQTQLLQGMYSLVMKTEKGVIYKKILIQ